MIESTSLSSPVCLFLLLVSFFFTFSLRTVGNHQAVHPKEVIHAQILMSGLMGVAILIMSTLMCLRGRLATKSHQHHAGHERDRISYLHKLALQGILMFFVLSSVLDINHFAAEIFCFGAWRDCANKMIRDVHSTDLAFHIIRISFCCLETALCWIYHELRFNRNYLVAHGLAVVMAANIVMWFDALISQSLDMIGGNDLANCTMIEVWKPNSTESNLPSLSEPVTVNTTELTEHLKSCWSKNDGEASWMRTSNKFMYPIAIEFTLLVSENLAGHFFTCLAKSGNDQVQGNSDDQIEARSAAITAASNDDTAKPADVLCMEASEQTPLLGGERNVNHGWKSWHSCFSKLFLILAAVMNVELVVLSIIVVNVSQVRDADKNAVQNMNFYDAYTWYSTAYLTILCACTVAGFRCIRSLPRSNVTTNSLEYLMLAAVVGPCFIGFTRFSDFIFVSRESRLQEVLYPLEDLLNVVQVVLQIIFYFQAKDVNFLGDTGGTAFPDNTANCKNSTLQAEYKESTSFSTRVAFEDILNVMAISNFTLWVADSFVLPLVYDKITPSGNSSHDWETLHNIIEPVAIFHRFNSAVFFWCAYKNVRKTAKSAAQ